jgi:HD superfamily phosphohydrolase
MEQAIREVLEDGYTEPVRDVLWGHVYLSPELAALTETRAFTRLTRIMQLGPAFYTYPGATHTRAAHSIGVYHLARRLAAALVPRGGEAWMSSAGVLSYLAAALLHDLGHFPYTHSLKELPLKEHEKLSGELILEEPLKSLIGKAGADPYLTAAIVDTSLPLQGDEFVFYRRLLSGVLDPDKLDYLNRDARYCGVPYGAQDVDFIFRHLYPDRERGLAIDSRGIPSVESVLFAKYLMYRTVYWHRSVRSATAMVKKAILGGLESGVIAPEELYGLDDQGLFYFLASKNYPLGKLAAAVRDGQLYTASVEVPYTEEEHGALAGLSTRSLHEERLAAEFSRMTGKTIQPEEVIIDLPEPVSFETGLYVRDEGKIFSASSSAFKDGLVADLTKTLRMVRVFIPQRYNFTVNDSQITGSLLNNQEKMIK